MSIAACGPASPTPAGPETPGLALTLTAWPTSPPAGFPTPLAGVGTPQPIWTATASDLRSPTPPTTPALPAGSPTPVPSTGSPSPPVQLAIPALDLDTAVVPVAWEPVTDGTGWTSQWQTAVGAVGHLVTSANLGEPGNVVLAGHHNTRGEVFRELSEIGLPGAQVAVGDDVVVTAADGQVYVYTIREWHRWEYATAPDEERRRQASYLEPTQDPTLTLVTCWPYESNTHRVVVVAELAP
jgi:sortase A